MSVTFNPFTGEMQLINSGGGGGTDANAFSIIQPDAGTSPTATGVTDTLGMGSADSSVTVTGDSLTKKIDFKVSSTIQSQLSTNTSNISTNTSNISTNTSNISSLQTAVGTPTDANTASQIVKRDGSGNFSAGTISASLTGAASLNVLKAGDTMTGTLALQVPKTTAQPFRLYTDDGTFNGTNTGFIYMQPEVSGTGTKLAFGSDTGHNIAFVNHNTSATRANWYCTNGAALEVDPGLSGQYGAVIRGDTGGSADIVVVTTSGGTLRFKVQSTGAVYSDSLTASQVLASDASKNIVSTGVASSAFATVFDPTQGCIFFDDFTGTATAGPPGWTIASTGTGATNVQSNTTITNARRGIWAMSPGTTSTGTASMRQYTGSMVLGGGAFSMQTSVYLSALSTSTDEYVFRWGLGTNITQNTDEAQGVWFEYDRLGQSANWVICTADNSTRTRTATSTAVAATTWTKLRIEVNAAGTSVTFYVNGSSVGTITTNIPVTSSRSCGEKFHMYATTYTSVQKFVYTDYHWSQLIFTNPR